MNTHMMLRVANAIENGELAQYQIGYNQKSCWIDYQAIHENQHPYSCATNACIAGWTVLINDLDQNGKLSYHQRWEVPPLARNLLDLDVNEKESLFFAVPLLQKSVTPSLAANVMRDMVRRYTAGETRPILPNWNLETL